MHILIYFYRRTKKLHVFVSSCLFVPNKTQFYPASQMGSVFFFAEKHSFIQLPKWGPFSFLLKVRLLQVLPLDGTEPGG